MGSKEEREYAVFLEKVKRTLNEKHAKEVLKVLSSYPFMMSGMPRPVRGRPVEPECLLNDHLSLVERYYCTGWILSSRFEAG
ncbi:4-diphosphocytidyl-2-C-methyl-D-erythritol kinase [Bienertia sinuspersici]